MEDLKMTIEKDIQDIYKKMQELRQCDGYKADWLVKDFKPYRNMAICLIKSFDSLNKLYNYKIEQNSLRMFVGILISEIEVINQIKEICKEYDAQYRCLQDTYLLLSDKLNKINLTNNIYEIEEICGTGYKQQVITSKNKIKFSHPNVKALILIISTKINENEIIMDIEFTIPFSSVEKAKEYLNLEVKSQGWQGIIIDLTK